MLFLFDMVAENRNYVVQNLKQALSTIGSNKIVADRYNVTEVTVSRWRSGKSSPTFDVVIDIANSAEVSVDWIVNGENNKTSYTILHSALWQTLNPLITLGMIQIPDDINKGELSRMLLKNIINHQQGGEEETVLFETNNDNLGKISSEVLKDTMQQLNMDISELSKSTDYSEDFIKLLLQDDSEWTVGCAKEIGAAINVSPVELLFPGVFDGMEKQYYDLLISADHRQREKIVAIRQAVSRQDTSIEN